ncbi:hypothetical protein HN51_009539 [Arachis hypogaea]|uniref:DUF4228 domain protein n=1 Tax=Arachis hypogaea TaxID=3818 RepID=A0A445CYX9_ARAHY|nr:uncharacterized protein LOC112802925 [Arachis hypogaea]QHO44058.1 uncharacterized protein DS421_5g167960 [Arachis hypogaea]RYR56119.1 hypothetical protein Ahy_A05g021908 isoform C [Arachis hypogaea]
MGNCLLGGMSEPEGVIKVITSNGGIMEFTAPVTVNFITNEFPGHAIFPSHDLFWKPLSSLDELEPGQSYYLLPISSNNNNKEAEEYPFATATAGCSIVRQGHVRSRSVPTTPHPPPYRMSLDYQHQKGAGLLKTRRISKENFSCKKLTSKNSTSTNSSSCRFWKVKLAITPEQLLEILSQETRTKELMESVRIVAKCGGVSSCAGSAAASIVSEDWSHSSSGRSVNSSKIDALVLDI